MGASRGGQSPWHADVPVEVGDGETALRIIGGSLSEYWTVSGGQFSEALGWHERALRQGEAAGASATARAWAMYGLTILAVHQGDYAAARRTGTEGLALARMADDPLLAALSPFVLNLAESSAGRREVGGPLVPAAVHAARATQDPGTLGWTLIALGPYRFHAGDHDGAAAALEEALALFQGCGGVWGECDALVNLSWIMRARGDLAGAARVLAESLRLRRSSRLLADVYMDLLGVVEIARVMGNGEAAARLLAAENTYSTSLGYVGVGGGIVLRREPLRQLLQEQLGDAQFRPVWDAGRALSIEEAIDEAIALADELATERI